MGDADVRPGRRVLGRYEIVRFVASGGMGSVFEARDGTLDQAVALKRVRFAHLSGPVAEQTRLRTLREARLAAQLRGNPHVVSVFDVEEDGGDVWIVQEYLPSRSLADITGSRETVPVTEAARIGAAVAGALAAAHARGIVHRDVTPGNVLISDDDGTVKLTDFGISHGVGEHTVTTTDAVAGTPAYMSPEVARGDGETPASDVYSLGATLYRAVEGRTPHGECDNSLQMLYRAANGTVAPPRRCGAFGALLLRLLDPDPAARPSAADTAGLLDDVARRQSAPTLEPSDLVDPVPASEQAERAAEPSQLPGSPATEETPRRSRRVLLGVAGLVVAALVAGGIVYANRAGPSAVPDLPESVAPLALAGDVRDVDPCALLDPDVMSRFGRPATIEPAQYVGGCRVAHDGPDGAFFTDVSFAANAADRPSELSLPAPQDLGGVRIFRAGVRKQACDNYIQLSDSTLIFVQSFADDDARDSCEIGEVAVRVAVARLAGNGVSYRPGWQRGITLAGRDACTIAGDALTRIPGLDPARRVPGSAGGWCFVGRPVAGSPYVQIYLGVERSGSIARFGRPGTAGGKRVYVRRPAPESPNPGACSVYLLHKPDDERGAHGPAEYIRATVEGVLPIDDLCGQATTLVVAAERTASA